MDVAKKPSDPRPRRGDHDFTDFFENATVALHCVGPDGTILRANKAELEMLGYAHDEYVGRDIRAFHADAATIDDILRRLRAGEEVHDRDARLECKDGTLLHVLISSSALFEDGKFIHTRCFTRDVTQQRRALRRLETRDAVTRELAVAPTLADAATAILQSVCESLEWQFGALWTPDAGANLLQCSATWHPPSLSIPRFVADSRARTFERGIGLPGRVWSSGAAAWIPDVVRDRNFPRAPLAESEGLHAAFALPIVLAGEFLGVLEFFSEEIRQPDDDLLQMMSAIGSQLGQFIERKRVEAEREALLARLATKFANARMLQEISAELVREGDVVRLYDRLLEAATSIMKSDGASMQMIDERENALRLIASRGFPPEFARTYEWVRVDSPTSCGTARSRVERVVVSDLKRCETIGVEPQQLMSFGVRAVQSTPLIAHDGRTIGMISTHWNAPHEPAEHELRAFDILARETADLIESKQAEEARRKQNERLRLLWDAAAVLLTADDPDAMLRGLFAKLGPPLGVDAYLNFMVNDAGDALRLASSEGIPPDAARAVARLELGHGVSGMVAATKKPIVATHIQQSADPAMQPGKAFDIRAFACNPLIVDGVLLGTLGFATRTKDEFDTDELAILETICRYVTVAYERLRLVNQLKETDRRKDEFLATLAHELRNPLAPVRNAVTVLRLKGPDEPELRWCRDVIERQVDHMTRLIDDLLDIARITRNKLELKKQRVQLAEVIQGAVESSRPLIEECGHTLTVSLPKEPVRLHADVVRLAQVFLNLLNNAAKYTDRGGKIALIAEKDGNDAIVVRVKDNGVGIPAENLPHLFEMFFQVDRSLDRSQGGLGIGLSLVRRLVELHGGKVEAKSEGVGKGSEFIVRLPVIADAPKAREADGAEGSETAAKTAKRKFLVVDDNRDSADSLAILLRTTGNEVRTVYDGLAAVEMAETYRPDVVLMDIGIPRLNGLDACRRIRGEAWGKGMMLIALTGWGQDEDRRRTVDAGFDGHLVKPVELGELMGLLGAEPH